MRDENTRRRTKCIFVCECQPGSARMPAETLAAVAQWFQDKLAEIPEEYRAIARCDFYEDEGSVGIEIYYERLETDEEINDRLAQDRAKAEIALKREVEEYQRLRAKYGSVEG